MKAALPAFETERLQALREYAVLDTAPEPGFDDLTQLASQVCEVPTALVTLIDEKRQWFKSHHGLSLSETHRDLAFCAHCILKPDLMEVPDATRDPRFVDNALVTGPPHIRFYAGVPLRNLAGFAVGTLAVLDYVPRTLREDQRQALQRLSRQAMAQLELRRQLLHQTQQTRVTGVELQRMEQRLQLALRATNDVIWDWDLLANTLWWNENFQTAFGYPPEQIEPGIESWTGRLHPDDLARVKAGTHRVLNGDGVRWTDEYRFRRADGSYAEIFDRGFVIRDGAGKPVRVIGAMQDITDRKRAAEAVRQSEVRFRALMEGGSNVVIVIGRDGKVSYASPAIRAVGGYDPDEVLGKSMLDFLHPDDLQTAQDTLVSMLNQPGVVRRAVWRLRHRDGFWRVFESAGKNLLGSPAVAGFVVNLHDITEREQTAAALHQAIAQRNAIFDSAGYSIIAADAEGRIRTVNRTAQQMLGYTAEEMLGRTPEFIHDAAEVALRARELSQELGHPIQPGVEVFMAKPRLTGHYEERPWTYIRKNGSRFPVQLAVAPLLNADHQPIGFVGIAHDITERQRAEEALRRSEEHLSALIYSVEGIVWEADAETFRFTFVSPQAERLLGYPTARWASEPTFWVDHIHPDDRKYASDYCMQCTREMRGHEFEYRMLAADGHAVWLRDIVTVVVEHGRPVKLRGIMVDITKSRQAGEVLKKHAAELEQFYKLSIGRELQMIELKKEVNTWAQKAGHPAPYDLSFMENR